jgi:ribosomal protein S21|tara:strand:- start:4512 stop:4760 length:249 start_codon:yes stop_codon:yes gene_type:complete
MQKRYKKVRREQMIIPGKFKAAKVINGNIEAALKFWKRQVKESNVLQELKDRKEFIKPSAVKRKQKMDAIRKEYIRRIRSND